MKAEKIKKALECCNTIGGCKVCPYSCNGKPTDNGECGEKMSLDALSLITEQEQRIKELAEEVESLNGKVAQYEEERKYHFEMSRKRIAEAKADTVREFAERLKAKAKGYPERCGECFAQNIDQIAKEMLEGEK